MEQWNLDFADTSKVHEGKTWLRKEEMAPSIVFLTNSNVCDREATFILHIHNFWSRITQENSLFAAEAAFWIAFSFFSRSLPNEIKAHTTLDIRSRYTRTPTRSRVLANLCNTVVSWHSVYRRQRRWTMAQFKSVTESYWA